MTGAAFTRTAVSAPGSAAEREADHAARSVLSGNHARIGERPRGVGSGWGAEAFARSAGEPLAPDVRAAMEPRFGFSFGNVRVHADAAAAETADRLGARAFAVGPHVGFAAGAYAPGRPAWLGLMADELTHVVQSRGSTDVVMRDTGALTDADLQRLANESAVEVTGAGFHEFDDVLRAARNGLIDVQDPAELERHLRYRAKAGDRAWEGSWTNEDFSDYATATDPARVQTEKWDRFVRDQYFAYLKDKADQWKKATERMDNAANLGKIFGGVALAGTLGIGGAAFFPAAGGASGLAGSAQFLAGRAAQAYLTKPLLALGASVTYGAVTPPGAPDLPGPGDDFGRALRSEEQTAARAADTAVEATREAERGAASEFSELFEDVLRRPFSQAGEPINVGGVGFGGVNAMLREGELVATYSHIINTGRVPGQGRAMHAAFEQGAVEVARSVGASSVRVGVSSVQNKTWAEHLGSLGYGNGEIEFVSGQFTFWSGRVLRP